MAVAGNTPTASFLTKMGKMQSAGCRLCRIAREARGESTDGLADETHGHINSVGCEGMATTVTAAHHSIWRHLYDSMHTAQKPKSKLKFVTLDKESNMSRPWRRAEFLRVRSKEELAEKAQDMEVTIPVKKSQETRYNLDRDEGFLEVKDAEANEQHKSIIGASKLLLRSGNLSRLTLWWVTADHWLRATSTRSSKSLIYKKKKKTSSSPIM